MKKSVDKICDWIESLIYSLFIVICIMLFGVKSFSVDGKSMVPTLEPGQRVIAVDFFYKAKNNDIVIIDSNNKYGKPLIKRIIAVSGQTIEINDFGDIIVDGIVIDRGSENVRGDMEYPLTVPEGYVFVMGDNRTVSLDSRDSRIGLIDDRCIAGKYLFVMGSGKNE